MLSYLIPNRNNYYFIAKIFCINTLEKGLQKMLIFFLNRFVKAEVF